MTLKFTKLIIFFFQVWEDCPIDSVVAPGPCVTPKHFVLKAMPAACPSSAVIEQIKELLQVISIAVTD